ncbi:MAG: 4-(cytidine 5'-diphospho)-2-C-methyl-D-erythritol kinase [Proteobacteria bacterium]|nr:4-(cytidine 5'-diphospho)-2-C-methyl-D-erythritol kinase [Pseudomonadota bacterium]
MSVKPLRLPAPAKLNLMLRVVGRRPDGYHLLQTVFQFIDWCDWIELRPRQDGKIGLSIPLPDVPEASDLTIRAAKLLRDAVGIGGLGVHIAVEKNLPMGGGLGGGSSDAATTLLGLNALWELGLSIDVLAGLGLQLGADVPVFVRGYAAWGEGVGEDLTPLPDLPEPWYLVVTPPCHVTTGAIFSSPELTRDNKRITIADFVAGRQENHCLPVVVKAHPQIGEAIKAVGAYSGSPKLTGTGSCVFGTFDSEPEAQNAARNLSAEWRVFVAKGMNRSCVHGALGIA